MIRKGFTAAPPAYDYSTVVERRAVGENKRGQTIYEVTMDASEYRIEYQLGRYASGLYGFTERLEDAY